MFRRSKRSAGTANPKNNSQTLNVCIIHADTIITGSVKTACNIRVDGAIHGNIIADKKIIINEQALIHGNVIGGSVEVKGKVKGDISSGTFLHLHQKAWVQGNLYTSKLIIDEGAMLNGGINSGKFNSSILKMEENKQIRQSEDWYKEKSNLKVSNI